MSLINILKKKDKADLFTTPSHSQRFFIFSKLKQFYKYDISENEAYNPQAALALAQKKASEIYGTKSTYFLTNGSTSGIIAAVLACTKGGENVLIWDKSHSCHANAVKLAGATPVFYELEKDEDWGVHGATSPEKIEEKLKLYNESQSKSPPPQPSPSRGEGASLLTSCKDSTKVFVDGEGSWVLPPPLRGRVVVGGAIKAVIVTSPTYEGIVSDVAKIKEICEKYGAYLIVDEAHGALYPFCDKLPTTAISQGADFVIQSLHKTAGGLNPTALLHCNLPRHCETSSSGSDDDCPPKQSPSSLDIQSALDLISTTSPSYPLLASIEKNINYLNSKKGRAIILELIENIENMKKNVPNVEFYQGNDATKILIKHLKLSGFEFSDLLFNKYKIEDEKANEKSVMLLCGLGTDLKKLKRLEKVLKSL